MPSVLEKRNFFIFIMIAVLITVLFFIQGNHQIILSVSGLVLGFLGLFRLIYLIEEKMKNIPSILTLPARLLFGLDKSEEAYKEKIIKRFQFKEIIIWFLIGFFYVLWALYCSFREVSFEQITTLFQKDLPFISAFSYLNSYNVLLSLISICIFGITIFLSVSYTQNQKLIKNAVLFLFFIFFSMAFVQFLQADFVNSLPPLYTALTQGIGWGKADLIFTYRPDIAVYPPTELFKRYIETGLIGAFLFYASFLPILISMVYGVMKRSRESIFSLVGLCVLLILFVTDSLIWPSFLTEPIKILGFVLIGLCWVPPNHKKT